MGFKIVLYPLTMIEASIAAMEAALQSLKSGKTPEGLAEFAHLRDVVGFNDYYEAEKKYAAGE
jgi:2-methylisocitrate lyase-like PEP mutase family enzyme